MPRGVLTALVGASRYLFLTAAILAALLLGPTLVDPASAGFAAGAAMLVSALPGQTSLADIMLPDPRAGDILAPHIRRPRPANRLPDDFGALAAAPTPVPTSRPTAAARVVPGAPAAPQPPAKSVRPALIPAQQQPPAPKVVEPGVYRDLSYDRLPGVEAFHTNLDIYVPAGAEGWPLAVFVHGGGWSGGDKSDVHAMPALFNDSGFVFASINYRLLPTAGHPDNAGDVAKALAWLQDNAARYRADPERIFVVGHSAGAQLSGLVATDERYLRAAGKPLTIIKGVVLLDSNAYDIPRLMPTLSGENVYSTAFGTDQALWLDASPARHVAPDKGIPPFLVVHANNDRSRQDQAENMATRLTQAGVPVELLNVPERDHSSVCNNMGQPADRASEAIVDYLVSLAD